MPTIYVPIFQGDVADNVWQKSYINRLKSDPPFGSKFPLYVGKKVLTDEEGNKIECNAFEVSEEMSKTPGEKEQTLHHYFTQDPEQVKVVVKEMEKKPAKRPEIK